MVATRVAGVHSCPLSVALKLVVGPAVVSSEALGTSTSILIARFGLGMSDGATFWSHAHTRDILVCVHACALGRVVVRYPRLSLTTLTLPTLIKADIFPGRTLPCPASPGS